MNGYQNKRLNMGLAVQQTFHDNEEKVAENPLLSGPVNELGNVIGKIEDHTTLQALTTKGVTRDKEVVREDLVVKIGEAASVLCVINESGVSATVQLQSDVTETKLARMSGNRLAAYSESVLTLAAEHSELLEEKGYSSEHLDAFDAVVEEWHRAIGKPRTAISRRAAATQELGQLFKDFTVLFKKRLDRVMKGYKKSDPEFYAAYRSARIVGVPRKRPVVPGKGVVEVG